MSTIICDIDRTIASPAHRDHLVDGPKPDWVKFMSPELVAKDDVIPKAKAAIDFLKKDHDFIFLTGRDEALREVTTKWLKKKIDIAVVPWSEAGHNLLMRKHDSKELPTEVKSEHLKKIVAAIYSPYGSQDLSVAFDDDLFMVPVYLKFGIIPLLAPGCWNYVAQVKNDLPKEKNWRR